MKTSVHYCKCYTNFDLLWHAFMKFCQISYIIQQKQWYELDTK